jgi:hypothetical protein
VTEEERILYAQAEINRILTKYHLEFAWDELDDGEIVVVLQSEENHAVETLQ